MCATTFIVINLTQHTVAMSKFQAHLGLSIS